MSVPNLASLCDSMSDYRGKFKLCHINAQSLLVQSHFAEFCEICESGIFDVITVSETWLRPHINSADVSIHGFSLFRCDRIDRDGGGVAVYVKSSLKVELLDLSDGKSGGPEFLFLSVGSGLDTCLVVVVYRPPKVAFGNELEAALARRVPDFKYVVVSGDFNTDFNPGFSPDKRYLSRLFSTQNLNLVPFNSTHVSFGAHTWLDLILVSSSTTVLNSGQMSVPGISKHDLIYVVCSLCVPRTPPRLVTFRDFKSFDINLFHEDLRKVDWGAVLKSSDINKVVEDFSSKYLEICDVHAPVRTVRVTRPPAPWMNDEIKLAQKMRDVAYQAYKISKCPIDGRIFRAKRNKVKLLIRNAKFNYNNSLFRDDMTSAEFWKNARLTGMIPSVPPTPVKYDLNDLNRHFVGHTTFDTGVLRDTASHYSSLPPVSEAQFDFSPVTCDEVREAIASINQSSKGTDGISAALLSHGLDVVLPIVTRIFNRSLGDGVFPDSWKIAIIRPIPKTKAPSSVSEYRPISLLCALSKALERLVYNQFMKFLENNDLLDPFQSGFRKRHGTVSALLKVTDDFRRAMDRRMVSFWVHFDFSKAFDLVNHKILLAKLKHLNLHDVALKWFSSYLQGRGQFVVDISGNKSDILACLVGVPQGSVLGPLLFCLYIRDIADSLHWCKYHLYADDLQIYCSFGTDEIERGISWLNEDIERLLAWAIRHGLVINAKKTQAMLVGYPRLLNLVDKTRLSPILVGGTSLPLRDSVCSLGVVFNSSLTWESQVAAVSRKAVGLVQRLNTFKAEVPRRVRSVLVRALVFPVLEYGCLLLTDLPGVLVTKLQRVQNSCIRYVFDLKRDVHVTPYYERLGWLKFLPRMRLLLLCCVLKILKSREPRYLADNFQFLSTSSRSSNLLMIPSNRTHAYNKSFVIESSRLWNKLPANLRNTELSVAVFREAAKGLLLEGLGNS